MMDIFAKCNEFEAAKQARASGLYPYFIPVEENRGSRVVMRGREVIMIGSNNYLGLSMDPRVQEASKRAVDKFGTSCSGSRLINGTFAIHEELEQRLARFVGREAALCFTAGYLANLGAISALLGRRDHILSDRYNHASIVDGIMLSIGLSNGTVHLHRYRHNNPENLEKTLAGLPEEEAKLIVTDGVFSMEGDIVKLPELRKVADKFGARVYLDEAHALGVLGATGKGTEEHFGTPGSADLVMATFSKSFGAIGGFIAGDEVVVDYIKHLSRPLIFTASMPPAMIGAVMATMDIIEKEPEHTQRLQHIARYMLKEFKRLGFDTGVAETPIIPLLIGDQEKTFTFWKVLFDNGVYANPIVSPAVPPDRTLIRTSYMSVHTDEELDQVLEICERAGKLVGII
ncbi:MAG: aminotransferase class I/II-fold pyridoxal phosphate-dependent enzyme [Spirochaetales bacterium]|nr:aminotransferase class I/II-fold pyridoxal phosphate-dependent enzyme [Spirochaetales bacterium]